MVQAMTGEDVAMQEISLLGILYPKTHRVHVIWPPVLKHYKHILGQGLHLLLSK